VQSYGPFLCIYWIRQYFLQFEGKRSCCMLMHSAICNYCRHSVPNIYKVEGTSFVCRLYWNKSNEAPRPNEVFWQTTRGMERIPQLILLIIISKGVFLKRVSGRQPTCLWCLSTTQLTMGGKRGRQATSNLDHAAPRQGCARAQLPAVSAMHEHKVEVYTSVQVHMREVAKLVQFPILTCI